MSTKTRLTGSIFLSKLITQYAFIHEKTVGKTAGEYIRQIGLRTGEWIEDFYGNREDDWSVSKYAEVIVDLKNSIGGDFYISSITPEYVIVKANRCPFGEMVRDAPHLCNMTSSVFGGIASRKFGYGKVDLKKRIAVGDLGCEVVIYFKANEFVDGDVYENLPRTPENVDPFQWENETIVLLNEELRKSDELVVRLLEELESLKKQVQMGRN
ncbi:methanogen output domain 1-containing protein [Sutcliffiella horikoshii]|uniref:methanogen output domain 1-containing protein n=1 Tax=Sutcliffiella horikoshii TaxID=79883 RepID=UPI001CBB8B36|nr:methanogen output domain 1-containing protein [Sutcliffiella horikoshii]UAL49067.1 methanogen output domain 1-containing protein [Sutcliffiella horikoshii]